MRARWYDAVLARFLTRDPVGGDATIPGSLNAYTYGLANPTLLSDPSGLCAAPRGGTGYCIDRFIRSERACVLVVCSKGDNRGFSQNCEDCYRIRTFIGVDGTRDVRIGESDTDFGPFGHRIGTGTAADCRTERSCAVRHGVLVAPPIYTEVTIGDDGSISVYGTPYPSLEIWHYENGVGVPVFLYDSTILDSGPMDLFPPAYRQLPNNGSIGGGSGSRRS